ncbi:MAG: ATP-dependent DNA helicase, partial [Patescibacteria group bacterium]
PRLVSQIGSAAYDVGIYTFHGFADMLILRYPDAYPTIIGGQPASDIERVQIVEAILADTAFKALRPFGDPQFYVQPTLRAIQTLKQEYVGVDDFALLVEKEKDNAAVILRYHEKGAHKGKERKEYLDAEKRVKRLQELSVVYRLYEASLRAQKRYDFDDMIVETVRALRADEHMLLDIQEQFQYVLADEHQDVNGSQNKILELLVGFHERPNLFVVGDEKQAIYRFQGASLDNFLYFEDTFKGSVTIPLSDNYRSGQTILDAAQDLISTDDSVVAALRTPLTAATVSHSTIELREFAHEAIEDEWLVGSLQKDLEQGMLAEDIAIIVRTNKEVETYAAYLRKHHIPVAPSADRDVLEHPITKSVLTLLRAAAQPTNPAGLVQLLHEPYWGISVADLMHILQAQRHTTSLVELIRDDEKLAEAKVSDIQAIRKIAQVVDHVHKETVTRAPHRVFELLLVESGFLHFVLETDPVEGALIVRRLYDEIEGMVNRNVISSLKDVIAQLELHVSYKLPLAAPFVNAGAAAVSVMTAHKAKGLEFSLVYLPHLTDRTWGKKRTTDLFSLPIVKHDVGDFDTIEDDERRLLYVGMTRAKHTLRLSHAAVGTDGKEQVASRFLAALSPAHISSVPTVAEHQEFSPTNALRVLPVIPIAKNLLTATLLERGLSPTALNNYLKSPWEYVYRNVLRVPQMKTPELQFGTALHRVLEKLVRQNAFDMNAAIKHLSEALNQQALSEEEYARLHERGLAALAAYTPHVASQAGEGSRTEVKLEAMLTTGLLEFHELTLTGTLDRIDYENGMIVRVIDYKTGKPKTRGQIEGTTKDSHGDYKRQLTFYALLLSLQSDTAMHCRTGVISFVEPDSRGVVREEVFTVSDADIAVLTAEIIRVTKEIVSGHALTLPCDEEVCHYCDLVEKLHTR